MTVRSTGVLPQCSRGFVLSCPARCSPQRVTDNPTTLPNQASVRVWWWRCSTHHGGDARRTSHTRPLTLSRTPHACNKRAEQRAARSVVATACVCIPASHHQQVTPPSHRSCMLKHLSTLQRRVVAASSRPSGVCCPARLSQPVWLVSQLQGACLSGVWPQKAVLPAAAATRHRSGSTFKLQIVVCRVPACIGGCRGWWRRGPPDAAASSAPRALWEAVGGERSIN